MANSDIGSRQTHDAGSADFPKGLTDTEIARCRGRGIIGISARHPDNKAMLKKVEFVMGVITGKGQSIQLMAQRQERVCSKTIRRSVYSD